MSSCQNDRPPTHTCHGVSYKHLAYQRQSSKNSDLCLYSDGKSPHMSAEHSKLLLNKLRLEPNNNIVS